MAKRRAGFSVDRIPGATQYTQHWVLYPGYYPPGPSFIGALDIIASPTERPYASLADFFQNVPWSQGSTYVRVDVQQFTGGPLVLSSLAPFTL